MYYGRKSMFEIPKMIDEMQRINPAFADSNARKISGLAKPAPGTKRSRQDKFVPFNSKIKIKTITKRQTKRSRQNIS